MNDWEPAIEIKEQVGIIDAPIQIEVKPKRLKVKLLDDPVNSPAHYTYGGIETIDYIKAKLTPEEFIGYLKGSVIKYTSRAGKKAELVQDLEKAQWYMSRQIKELKGEVK